jgi:hypothetical protein
MIQKWPILFCLYSMTCSQQLSWTKILDSSNQNNFKSSSEESGFQWTPIDKSAIFLNSRIGLTSSSEWGVVVPPITHKFTKDRIPWRASVKNPRKKRQRIKNPLNPPIITLSGLSNVQIKSGGEVFMGTFIIDSLTPQTTNSATTNKEISEKTTLEIDVDDEISTTQEIPQTTSQIETRNTEIPTITTTRKVIMAMA